MWHKIEKITLWCEDRVRLHQEELKTSSPTQCWPRRYSGRAPGRLCIALLLAKRTLRIHRMGAHKHTKHTRAAKPQRRISSRLHLFASWCVSITLSHWRIHHMVLSLAASSWTLHYVSLLSGRAPRMLHSASANKNMFLWIHIFSHCIIWIPVIFGYYFHRALKHPASNYPT